MLYLALFCGGTTAVAFLALVIAPYLWPIDPKRPLNAEERSPEARKRRQKTLEHYQSLCLMYSCLGGLAVALFLTTSVGDHPLAPLGHALAIVVIFAQIAYEVRHLSAVRNRRHTPQPAF